MPSGLVFSLILHAAVMLIAAITLPNLNRTAASSAMPVQVVRVSDIPNPPASLQKPMAVPQTQPEPLRSEAPPTSLKSPPARVETPPAPPPPKPAEATRVEPPPPPPKPPEPAKIDLPPPKPTPPESTNLAALPAAPRPEPRPEVKPEPRPEVKPEPKREVRPEPPKKELEPVKKEPPLVRKEPEPPKPAERPREVQKPKPDEFASIEKLLKDVRKTPPRPEPAKPEPRKPDAKRPDFDEVMKTVQNLRPQEQRPQPRPQDLSSVAAALSAPSRSLSSSPLSSSEHDALRRQIEGCWSVPAGVRDAQDMIVEVKVSLDPEGKVLRVEALRSPLSGNQSFQAAADAAVRAVHKCQATHGRLNVPRDKYNLWREMTLRFDPKDLLS